MWEANTLRPSQPPAGRGFLGARGEGWLLVGEAGLVPPVGERGPAFATTPSCSPRGSMQRGTRGSGLALAGAAPRPPLAPSPLGKQPLYLGHLPTCKQPCVPRGPLLAHMPSAPMSQVRSFTLGRANGGQRL